MWILLKYPDDTKNLEVDIDTDPALLELKEKYPLGYAKLSKCGTHALINYALQFNKRKSKVVELIKTAKSAIDTYKADKKEVSTKIREIYKKAAESPTFSIHKMKVGKQIRIYFSSYYVDKYKELGYSIIEQPRLKANEVWNDDSMSYEANEDDRDTTYSFIMNTKAFKSCCKSGIIAYKGYYVDEQGERRRIEQSGQKEAIQIRDDKGKIHDFSSKSDAAKEFNVSPAMITKLIKATPDGEIPTLSVKAKDNKKGFSLITANGDKLDFVSLTDAARYYNCDIMKISRAIKNKSLGDKVKLLGEYYTLGS